MTRFKSGNLLLFIVCLLMVFSSNITRAETLKIYVVPQYNPTQIHAEWTPLINRISQDTGITLQLVVMSSIPKFEKSLLHGEPDIALVNPYHAVMAKAAKGYLPFLKDAKPLSGILLVRKDSPYQTLQDLDGKEIGFPAPNAFGASLFMRALLSDAKVAFREKYLNTHGNVYRNILNGGVAAGGGVNNTLNDESPDVKAQLRILYQSPLSASHPLVAHPRVPLKTVQTILAAFLALKNDASGEKLLKEVRIPNPAMASYDIDYLPLEKLKIDKYVIVEKD
nr:phosphate/phosphite/phosphonate ABC transporter substrate-binding protein [uncultured Undibacterium sp.]